MKIIDSVYYVGVDDCQKQLFEGLWTLPNGVSYNAYVVVGDKTALIDTVEVGFADRLLDNIRKVLGDKPLDYVVINHMEPDHSSSIAKVREAYPDVTVIGNAKTLQMLAGYYAIDQQTLTVADDTVLNLGNIDLSFHLTPMVHWPETMMTYIPQRRLLFSGDAFGCFGALRGGITDANMDTTLYIGEMYRYYSAIVGKYGIPVQNAMKKLAGIPVEVVCSTHGPVWHRDLAKVLGIYDRLSRYEGEQGVVIAYGTMYGNNAAAATHIAEGLTSRGVKNIKIHDLSATDLATVLADVFRYDTLIVGSPTYNGELFPPVEALMRALQARGLSGRRFTCFGSFTWAGVAVKKLRECAEAMKFNIIEPSAEFKYGFVNNEMQPFDALAEAVASAMK